MSALRNDQISFEVAFGSKDTETLPLSPTPRDGTPAAQILGEPVRQPVPQAAVPLLLAALDDPGRFLAAHVLLNDVLERDAGWETSFRWESYPLRATGDFDGLRVDLSLPKTMAPSASAKVDKLWGMVHYDAAFSSAQMPVIREQWHRRLDERILTVAFWKVAATFLVLPVVWLLIAVSRLNRVKSLQVRCLCTACGYDLRATPDRCPECGHVPDGAKATT